MLLINYDTLRWALNFEVSQWSEVTGYQSLKLSLGPHSQRKVVFNQVSIYLFLLLLNIPYQWKRMDFLCSYQASSDWPNDKDLKPGDLEFKIQADSILTTFTKLQSPVSQLKIVRWQQIFGVFVKKFWVFGTFEPRNYENFSLMMSFRTPSFIKLISMSQTKQKVKAFTLGERIKDS